MFDYLLITFANSIRIVSNCRPDSSNLDWPWLAPSQLSAITYPPSHSPKHQTHALPWLKSLTWSDCSLSVPRLTGDCDTLSR
jgi:hypothetical protein